MLHDNRIRATVLHNINSNTADRIAAATDTHRRDSESGRAGNVIFASFYVGNSDCCRITYIDVVTIADLILGGVYNIITFFHRNGGLLLCTIICEWPTINIYRWIQDNGQ